ncbi:MAG: peptide chain release factor N(5)-glutamine methyltransferase [Eubacterium sp.]|nr:peptide chain release factor N(5)-glutamine methyltransferase [Eubacterium sp.]
MLVKDFVKENIDKLDAAGISDASVDIWLLLEHFAQIKKSDYFANQDMTISKVDAEEIEEAVEKRINHIPVQHIIGETEFMGLTFKVNDKVLVPRLDTEILVDEVVKYVGDDFVKILDMCTGSGCIAITVSDMCDNATVVGSDVSKDAIEVAGKNNEINCTDVEFVESDLFNNIEGLFDVIVSNPPYIKTEEIENLMDEVKLHDPRLALDGGESGLDFYKQIIEQSKEYLKTDGKIFFEIGFDQAEEVSSILKENNYHDIVVKKDLSGLDRVVIATRN